MATMRDRLERLERRRGQKYEPNPRLALTTSVLLKDTDAQRRALDGLPPDPANALTPEEEIADREATRSFLPYLLAERERASPETTEALGWAIAETRAEIARLSRGGEA